VTIRVEITVPTIGAKSAVLLTASLVSSLIMLDSNIVAVSLPAIGRSLAASFTDIQWVVSAYVLTYAALLERIPYARRGSVVRTLLLKIAVAPTSWKRISSASLEFLLTNARALWVGGRLVFPYNVERTRHLVEEDFEDAAAILNQSPRGATALMRVCIQKLVPLLKQDGHYLNDYISSLVRKALELEIRQSMEVLQVLRNDPGQPSNLETQEDKEMALRFVDSLKAILERRML
jgi:hypothetical protein